MLRIRRGVACCARSRFNNAAIRAQQATPLRTVRTLVRLFQWFRTVLLCYESQHKRTVPLCDTSSDKATEVFLVRFEGAKIMKDTNKTDDNIIKYYKPYIGMFYQDAAQRRKFASKY